MDEDLFPSITDSEEGITLSIPIQLGISLNFYMTDESAQSMVDIIQNKLNARMKV